tara:strand:+ start:109 stop:1323 length:1215 start_codon:yes stop_codon:yes gene_type:complete
MITGHAITHRFIGSINDFLISLVLLAIFLFLIIRFIKKNNLNLKIVFGLIIYRLLFLLFLIFYAAKSGTFDGHGIYNAAGPQFEETLIGYNLKQFTGSFFLSILIRPLVEYLNLSYISVSLIFLYFGTFGILFCYSIYNKLNNESNYIKIFIIAFCFNPALNIFTVSITKDTIIFFLIMYLFYIYFVEQLNLKKLLYYSIIPVGLIFFIRPYIGGIMLASFFPYYISNLKGFNIRILIKLALIIVLVIFTFYISRNLYAWNHDGNLIEQFKNFIFARQNNTNVGNTILNYNQGEILIRFIQSIFGFGVYKSGFLAPVFLYDQILSIYLFLLIILVKLNNFSNFKKLYFHDYEFLKYFIIYALFAYFICSISLSNFGLILRLKWMYWPIITFFILSLLSKHEKKA